MIHQFWQDGIEVFDPNTGLNAHYETFRPRSARQHAESAYGGSWYSDAMAGGGSSFDSSSDPGMSYIDDDDEYEDVVRCVHPPFQLVSIG